MKGGNRTKVKKSLMCNHLDVFNVGSGEECSEIFTDLKLFCFLRQFFVTKYHVKECRADIIARIGLKYQFHY